MIDHVVLRPPLTGPRFCEIFPRGCDDIIVATKLAQKCFHTGRSSFFRFDENEFVFVTYDHSTVVVLRWAEMLPN